VDHASVHVATAAEANEGDSMHLRKKALLAAGCALSASVLVARPADAATASAHQDVTFVRGGREVTCTLSGESTYTLLGRNPGTSEVDAYTQVTGSDPACSSGVGIRVAAVSYKGEKSVGSFDSSAPDATYVSGSSRFPGVATHVVVLHLAEFVCDENPINSCTFSFDTSPK
jgi:hypothetical protein